MLRKNLVKISFLIFFLVLGFYSITNFAFSSDGNDISFGFGKHYKWIQFDRSFEIALSNKTPIMLIIHKEVCAACSAFKERFANSSDASTLSRNFVMVNALSNTLTDDKYMPDGNYVPRILFLDYNGNINKNIYNMGGNIDYKFFYYNIGPVVDSMKKAVAVFKNNQENMEL